IATVAFIDKCEIIKYIRSVAVGEKGGNIDGPHTQACVESTEKVGCRILARHHAEARRVFVDDIAVCIIPQWLAGGGINTGVLRQVVLRPVVTERTFLGTVNQFRLSSTNFEHFVLVEGNIESACPTDGARLNQRSTESHLPSAVFDRCGIRQHAVEARETRHRNVEQQICSRSVIALDGTGQPIIEQRKVKSDVGLYRTFPGKVRVRNLTWGECRDTIVSRCRKQTLR